MVAQSNNRGREFTLPWEEFLKYLERKSSTASVEGEEPPLDSREYADTNTSDNLEPHMEVL